MNKKAFTLIEILVVITIVGIISGIVVVQMNEATNAVQDSKKKANLDSIRKALIIHYAEKGNYPIESGCTIGNCTNFDAQMSELLPTQPADSYSYQSDGNGCTLSVTLSTGYIYQYDCLTKTTSSNQPVAGACGSSNGANLSLIPNENLCSIGTASSVSGSGPWSWTCTGDYGGAVVSCATGELPVAGACGSANSFYSLPTVSTPNLCASGQTPFSIAGTSSITWGCSGLNGGTDTTSTACSGSLACPLSGATGSLICQASVVDGDIVNKFTGAGSGTWTTPNGISETEILIVGGGGGGGGGQRFTAGGGGGGGVLYGTLTGLGTSYTVTVGAAGIGACTGTRAGCSGGNSSFGTYTAYGGGGGACGPGRPYINGNSGGSGGGASQGDDEGGLASSSTQTSQAPLTGYGNGGGAANNCGTGGGGAGAASGWCSAAGGAGRDFSITGGSVTYATGGSWGGSYVANDVGNGGPGGYAGSYGGNGGGGTIILRY